MDDIGNVHAWAEHLVAAVEADNERPHLPCSDSATLSVLRAAPAAVLPHARLAIADLEAAADRDLSGLRSDQVARHFTIRSAELNVLVGRMVVPGGPQPGRFRLEALVFTGEPAAMPGEFPAAHRTGVLHFGQLSTASQGYTAGSGAVAFPEQLAVRERPAGQAYGVVFAGKLADLFLRVLPLLDEETLRVIGLAPHGLAEIRQYAFLAHEWGHEQGRRPEQTVVTRRRRLIAVMAELHADLEALAMLSDLASPLATAAATVLIADRIAREAWLPRPFAQVDAIAARQLLDLLLCAGAVAFAPSGRVHLDLAGASQRARQELERVRAVEEECCVRGLEPAENYLRERGWEVVGQACHREPEHRLARFLAYAATPEPGLSPPGQPRGVALRATAR
jgi:hypothetical protein